MALLREERFAPLFGAAALLAVIPLTNWLSAFALAISAALLLLSEFRIGRAFLAAGLAYLLASFWLTPTFVQTIAFNWPADSFGYQLRSKQKLLLAAVIVGPVLVRALWRGSAYFCFVTWVHWSSARSRPRITCTGWTSSRGRAGMPSNSSSS